MFSNFMLLLMATFNNDASSDDASSDDACSFKSQNPEYRAVLYSICIKRSSVLQVATFSGDVSVVRCSDLSRHRLSSSKIAKRIHAEQIRPSEGIRVEY